MDYNELDLRDGKGIAPASGAVFRALAENPVAPKRFERSCQCRAQEAGREARPATPGAGVLPNFGDQDEPLINMNSNQRTNYLSSVNCARSTVH